MTEAETIAAIERRAGVYFVRAARGEPGRNEKRARMLIVTADCMRERLSASLPPGHSMAAALSQLAEWAA